MCTEIGSCVSFRAEIAHLTLEFQSGLYSFWVELFGYIPKASLLFKNYVRLINRTRDNCYKIFLGSMSSDKRLEIGFNRDDDTCIPLQMKILNFVIPILMCVLFSHIENTTFCIIVSFVSNVKPQC